MKKMYIMCPYLQFRDNSMTFNEYRQAMDQAFNELRDAEANRLLAYKTTHKEFSKEVRDAARAIADKAAACLNKPYFKAQN